VLALRVLGHRQVEPRGIVSGLMDLQREVGDVARFVLALREIHRGILNVREGALMREHGVVALEIIDRHLDLGDEPQGLIGDAELRRGEPVGGDAFAQRQHQQIEQVERGSFLPIRAGRRAVGKAHA